MSDEGLWQHMRDSAGRALLLPGKTMLQRVRRATGAVKGRRHIFVAGMQRSGTNMMMDVLERSLETDVYHERDPRAFDNYQLRPRPVIHALAARSPAPVFIIKALCELQELRALLDEFVPAQAVWVMRHYEDVANSMLVSFRNQAKQVLRIAADRNGSGWLGRGMSDQTHALVRSVTHSDLDEVSAAALQWYFRNVLYFDQGLERDPRVLAVNYEALVTDPQTQFRRIFGFLGLDYTPRVASRIFASSIGRRSPPPIALEVRELCEGLYQRIQASIAAGSGDG